MIAYGNSSLKLISGSSHPELSQEIAQYLNISLAPIKISRFSCGEIYARSEENVRGAVTYVIQTCGTYTVNENLMELFLLIDALRRSSVKQVNVVIPYYGYSRQDKKSAPREPISAKLVADLLITAGTNRIVTIDLHSDQIQGFFNVPLDHLTALPLLAKYLKGRDLNNTVVVAPDTGRVKTAKKLADRIGLPIAVLHKTRPEHNQTEITNIVGEIKNKKIIIVDDMIDTAGSVTNGVEALIKNGALPGITIVATHGVFSGPAPQKLNNKNIAEVVVTNSIPMTPERRFPQLKIISAAPLLAEAIKRNYQNQSISELFD